MKIMALSSNFCLSFRMVFVPLCAPPASPSAPHPLHTEPRGGASGWTFIFSSVFKVTLFRSNRATHITLPLKNLHGSFRNASSTEHSQKRVGGTNSLPLNLFVACILNISCSVYLSRRHVNNSREDWCQRKEGDCRLYDDFNYYNYWKIIQQHHRFVFCLGRKV